MRPVPRMDRSSRSGRIAVYAYAQDGTRHDVTVVRGVPTTVQSFATTDPFGPSTAELSFPALSALDAFTTSELPWYAPYASIDIIWLGAEGPVTLWEGHAVSYDASIEDGGAGLGVDMSCVGALRQLDDFLAKPLYLTNPLPYEEAIRQSFPPYTRLGDLSVEFPSWWPTTFRDAEWAQRPPWMKPLYLRDGQQWSGMVTRSTGNYEQVLSNYIQQLLTVMHTPRGQFTLMLDPGRAPVLRHRDNLTSPRDDTLYVDVVNPGVSLSVSRDFTQRVDVVYAKGKTLAGLSYSSMETTNGGHTKYVPYAHLRHAYPASPSNRDFRTGGIRKEAVLDYAEGLTESDAIAAAKNHLRRHSDAGFTGRLTIKCDMRDMAGRTVLRHEIRAGDTLLLNTVFGEPKGVLVHAVEVSYSPSNDQTTITFDSKFRDQLTVAEVRLRGRDSMTPIRLITPGSFQPPTPDRLLPWDFERSGYIPEGSHSLFRNAPEDLTFPWESWTKARPPKMPQWRDYYIKIPVRASRNENANLNWSDAKRAGTALTAHPIYMGQAGKVRLIQVAAFDKDGNVMRVPFHLSLYTNNTVSYMDMPMMDNKDAEGINKKNASRTNFKAGQHNPFFPGAWEQFNEDGTKPPTGTNRMGAEGTGIVAAWGNSFEYAGYVPGSSASPGDKPTGLLVDETGFSFDTTAFTQFDLYKAKTYAKLMDDKVGRVYAMIYCDEHTEDVYFLGRMYNQPPDSVV